MKRTIKGLLFLLVFVSMIPLYNCEKDNVVVDEIEKENGQNSMFSKGKLNQYSKLVTFVEELKQKQETGALNKNSSLGNTNNFIILENEDVSVYTGVTSTTYTIPILKTNQVANTFSNLVIKFSDTETTKAMLMNYEPSQSYLDALVTNTEAPYSGYASYEAITYDGSFDHLAKGCRTISMTYCNWGTNGTHTATDECTPSYMWTTRITFCNDAVDPPPALIDNSTGGTGGNNGSDVENLLPTDDDIVTTPIIEKDIVQQSIIDCINGVGQLNTTDPTTIDIEILGQLSLTYEEWNDINSYLQENDCSETAQSFIVTAFEELIADNQLTLEEYRRSQVVFDAPDVGIDDIRDYLDCFNLFENAEITIYVDQPVPNSDETWVSTGEIKAGHTYVGITQGNVTRTLGLYPAGSADPIAPNDPHAFGNDEGNEFHVSITFSVSGGDLALIINNANNYNQNYDLNTNNCTDYAIQTAESVGVILPDPQGTWIGGGGSNPAGFGQALRNMPLQEGMTRNTTGGNASANNGDCN